MLYRVAAGTGFRAGELASLTPRNFDLDADTPAIRLEAKSSKRRCADVQPIREDLAATLKPWLADRPATKTVWPGWWRDQAAEMIRADLRRARAR
jgi:integrase